MKPSNYAAFSHAALSIVIQILGFSIALLLHKAASPLPAPIGILLWPVLGFFCARFFRLPTAWQLFNLMLPIALVVSIFYQLSSYLFGIGALVTLLIYLPTFWTHVPYYPSSQEMYQVILNELPHDKPFRFVDLGSGFGHLLFFLAQKCPQANFVGVEVSILPFAISWMRSKLLGLANLNFQLTSIWTLDLGNFDVVYAFLAPGPMPELYRKASKEMSNPSFCLINSFPFPQTADKDIAVHDKRNCVLYRYSFKNSKG